MLHLRDYVRVSTAEEALELNRKKNNCILGGTGWLKMSDRNIGTGIDLSNLGLDTIVEEEDCFRIGAMVTLRRLELHEGINALTHGSVRESLRHIVGVQFRNCATVGGTFWGRFGFSDPLTCFLALGAQVRLCQGGVLPLEAFVNLPYDRDVLLEVLLPKEPVQAVYQSFRNTATDFPVLAVSVVKKNGVWRCAVGARPDRAALVTAEKPEDLLPQVLNLRYGTNQRASEEYRRHLAEVLLNRCLRELEVQA